MFRRPWRTKGAVPIGVALASTMPLLWPSIPPLIDLPGHLASYHVSIAIAHSEVLQRFFVFNWHVIGNLGVDLLVVPLAPLVGVEPATKLIVLAIPMVTTLALLLLSRRAHGRLPATALAAVPLVYNYPFLFGFVNYSLAAAFALLGLALWQRWPSDRHSSFRLAVFAVIAAIIWVAHAIGWVMLCAMCTSFELNRRLSTDKPTSLQAAIHSVASSAFACLSLAIPIGLTLLRPRVDQGGTSGWLWVREMWWAAARTLRDRWGAWDAFSIAILIALVAAALFRVGKLRLVPSLGWPAFAVLALFICLPMSIDGSLYVNTRLFPYFLALSVIAIDTDALMCRTQVAVAQAAALFCALRLIGNTVSFYLYDASYNRELAALNYVPRGAAVLTLVEMPCAPGPRHRLDHLAGMATVRRDAFVNVLWTIDGLQLLRDRMPQAAPFREDPSEFVSPASCASYQSVSAALAAAPLRTFTHLWLIAVPPDQRPRDSRLLPVWSAGNSILYRLAS